MTIEQRDVFTLELREADVVMLYLSPELNERLLPQLARLKPCARVVSHAFEIPGVTPDRVVTVPIRPRTTSTTRSTSGPRR